MRLPPKGYHAEAEQGHRRGVVLGLTLAEIMLLLLFCLLLVAAALIREREQKLQDAEAKLADLSRLVNEEYRGSDLETLLKKQAELRELQADHDRLLTVISTMAGRDVSAPEPEETWRELVSTYQLGRALTDHGVHLAEVDEFRELLVKLQELPEATIEQMVQAATAETADVAELLQPAPHDWPPIITLGNDEFRFVVNSAELSPEFRDRLTSDIAEQVRGLLNEFSVDVVEVVGHTDEQPIRSTQQSTLDAMVLPVLNGKAPVTALIPADNAGLGLARAISVAKVLAYALDEADIKVIPPSGAQLVLADHRISDGTNPLDDRDRRRIEIRVRRSE